MIVYNKKNCRTQIKDDIKELELYKGSYQKRINLYNIYLSTMDIFKNENIESNGLNKDELNNKIKVFQTQVYKIDNNLNTLNSILKTSRKTRKINVENKVIDKYNQRYIEIRNSYLNNSIGEEEITTNFIHGILTDFIGMTEKMQQEHNKEIEKIKNIRTVQDIKEVNSQKETEQKQENVEANESIEYDTSPNNQIKNNNTLLISEKQNKIILPYTAKEVLEILNNKNNNYQTTEEVIEKEFTRDFSEYRIQFKSRYNETMKLAREREHYGLLESISLATEMMRKRLLHPAIISACRTVDELDVYLDCLDKNELNDFKIFKIKYELYPMVVKNKDNYEFENKRETNHKSKNKNIKKGTRYQKETKTIIWKKIKNSLNMKRAEGYK